MSSLKFSTLLISLFLFCSFMTVAQNSSTLSGKDFITKDTIFKEPYVDVDEWRETPVRHRYVHGGFKGTNTRFSFYFPTQENYQGRFFQYITPFPDNEFLSQGATGEEDKIGFAMSSGAYFIETSYIQTTRRRCRHTLSKDTKPFTRTCGS